MLVASDISLSFGKRTLFKDVNISFTPGNCYGLIGANGSGKSTFLKILSGEIEPSSGTVSKDHRERIAVLRQDHFAFDDVPVLETVIRGHAVLWNLMRERDEIYAKETFSDEDGLRAGEIEAEFAEMNGYEAETEAASLLMKLGIDEGLQSKLMRDLEDSQKVRVLLAQALFGNPDILLLDEPTNHLDMRSVMWLESFLANFQNTVIVVSHDRHFLDRVCSHIADIDFGKIQIYSGNYSFWQQASQLAMQQKKDLNKKNADKIKELQEFVQRFSANASKSKQATSRKKLIEKLELEELPSSSRRFPYVAFSPEREVGNVILNVTGLSMKIEGEQVLDKFDLTVNKGDRIAFVGNMTLAKTTLFRVLAGEIKPDAGEYHWGQTITLSYFPKENTEYFNSDNNLVEWLRQYSTNQEEAFVRGFLGRMLFSGEEGLKKARVLSGGERVRCMLARMMLSGANAMILDEPTSHLDLEAISSLNTGLENFQGVLLFASHDHQLVESVANRIIEFTPKGVIDRMMDFDEYIESEEIAALRNQMYGHAQDLML
ncbi:MAG TPA: ATP-binding cassette domain-containing protein [Spirochaetota bacterium]|nr:ATP-binding cassette domain-containing protein [Spirochaetota bacterium]HPH02513.1 ATP-binding cassette domain-containing protein [Spirochaetota bacterium]HPN83381.1 ATP-binding cassette domain-containing protein [Spirochaetota bacterium]